MSLALIAARTVVPIGMYQAIRFRYRQELGEPSRAARPRAGSGRIRRSCRMEGSLEGRNVLTFFLFSTIGSPLRMRREFSSFYAATPRHEVQAWSIPCGAPRNPLPGGSGGFGNHQDPLHLPGRRAGDFGDSLVLDPGAAPPGLEQTFALPGLSLIRLPRTPAEDRVATIATHSLTTSPAQAASRWGFRPLQLGERDRNSLDTGPYPPYRSSMCLSIQAHKSTKLQRS